MVGLDIRGLDRAELLAGLFNRAKVENGKKDLFPYLMDREFAAPIIDSMPRHGKITSIANRQLDIVIGQRILSTGGYDAANGVGAGLEVVHALRTGTRPPTWEDVNGLPKRGPKPADGNDEQSGEGCEVADFYRMIYPNGITEMIVNIQPHHLEDDAARNAAIIQNSLREQSGRTPILAYMRSQIRL